MAAVDPTREHVAHDQTELVDFLVQTSFVTMAALNKIGAGQNLSLSQLRVLGILRDRRLKMTELADFLGLDKSTMSGLVDRAEKRGLLTRAPNPHDGRATDVVLSAGGAELAAQVSGEVADSLSPMTGTLTSADRRRLTSLLERLLTQP